MLKIGVASLNPVKIAAVEDAFSKVFPEFRIECRGIKAPSHVKEQPLGDGETLQGAVNRARSAQQMSSGYDYYVGIEGGCQVVDNDMYGFGWIAIINAQGTAHKGKSCCFVLPKEIGAAIQNGGELGPLMDEYANRTNIKHKEGAIGFLTHGLISRKELYVPAIIMALSPFKV